MSQLYFVICTSCGHKNVLHASYKCDWICSACGFDMNKRDDECSEEKE